MKKRRRACVRFSSVLTHRKATTNAHAAGTHMTQRRCWRTRASNASATTSPRCVHGHRSASAFRGGGGGGGARHARTTRRCSLCGPRWSCSWPTPQMQVLKARQRETELASAYVGRKPAAQHGAWVLVGDLWVHAPPAVAQSVVRAGALAISDARGRAHVDASGGP